MFKKSHTNKNFKLKGNHLGPQLLRVFKLREGISIQIGSMIGSGIFIVPAIISKNLESMGPILIAWILGGALVFFGSLSLAELSSMFPVSGGPYVYIRESFGRVWAFLYSWNYFFVCSAGSVAALSVAFATYMGYFLPHLSLDNIIIKYSINLFGNYIQLSIGYIQIVAIFCIALITAINIRGAKFAGWLLNILTLSKIIVLGTLILVIFFSGKGNISNYTPWWPNHWTKDLIVPFGLSFISVLWAYDGWAIITLTSGEFKNPRRNIPLAMLIGTITVILVYICANLGYAYIVPITHMSNSPRIAADVAQIVLGPKGTSFIVIGILCSTLGALSSSILGSPRSVYAAGIDNSFAKSFRKIHPRFKTPYFALITFGIWSGLLTLSGTYEQIISYVIFSSWIFYLLCVSAVILLRLKAPHAERPYKTWGFPYTSIVFIVVAGWFLLNTLKNDLRNALIGILLLLISLPFYAFWSRKSRLNLNVDSESTNNE